MSELHCFVIPVYNEQDGIKRFFEVFYRDVVMVLEAQGHRSQLIFVNDGSKDQSFEILKQLALDWSGLVHVVSLSRNFGHQIAITAGMDFAKGDTVSVIDADLQDPPRVLLQMIDKWRQGHDVVFATRRVRAKESFFKRFTAYAFYRLLAWATQLHIPVDTGDFRLMSQRSVQALQKLPEQHRFVRGLAKWVGFKQSEVLYDREPRFAGTTHYPIKKMVKLAWDAFTGFSSLPLKVSMFFGILATFFGFIVALWALYIRLFTTRSVQGWTSLMVMVLFMGGVQLLSIGILGEYIGRIFDESKRRPLYIVQEYI